VREDDGTVLGDVLVEQDAGLGIAQQARQRGLALKKRAIAQILAIMFDRVESAEDCILPVDSAARSAGRCYVVLF
jgi:hypothetical protein